MNTFDTCFFERYAKISLESLLGARYADLVNRDRPDLQSGDGISIGVEVTRAMEESKDAARSLLHEIAGIEPTAEEKDDFERIISSGYGYGLQGGRYIGSKELDYWSMALPMRRIIKSKVSKATSGFYGNFDLLGLYVFSKESLDEMEVIEIMKLAMELQESSEIKYDRLFLSEVSSLNVCNLSGDLNLTSRICQYPISMEQRREFFLSALTRE